MGLVDREKGDRHPLLFQPRQSIQPPRQQPLRREVQQIKVAAPEIPLDRLGLRRLEARMQGGGPHAGLAERLHLVLHQGDQW